MFTVAFWKASAERAAKTAAQMIGLTWFASDSGAGNLFDLDWEQIIGAAAFGVVSSIVFSIASIPLSSGGGPSLQPAAEIEANSTP